MNLTAARSLSYFSMAKNQKKPVSEHSEANVDVPFLIMEVPVRANMPHVFILIVHVVHAAWNTSKGSC